MLEATPRLSREPFERPQLADPRPIKKPCMVDTSGTDTISDNETHSTTVSGQEVSDQRQEPGFLSLAAVWIFNALLDKVLCQRLCFMRCQVT